MRTQWFILFWAISIDKHNSDILLDDKTVKMRAMPMIMIVSSLSLKGGDRMKEEHITEWQK